MPALLPFTLNKKSITFEGKQYAISADTLDWADKSGQWQVVLLQDMSDWLPLWQAALLAALIIAAMSIIRWVWLLQRRMEAETVAAAEAKLACSEAASYVTNKAVQFHGGYGYIKDYPVERMYRDAKITEIYEGTSEVMKMVMSGEIFK